VLEAGLAEREKPATTEVWDAKAFTKPAATGEPSPIVSVIF
jgi:hypothetical protein